MPQHYKNDCQSLTSLWRNCGLLVFKLLLQFIEVCMHLFMHHYEVWTLTVVQIISSTTTMLDCWYEVCDLICYIWLSAVLCINTKHLPLLLKLFLKSFSFIQMHLCNPKLCCRA